MDILRGLIKLFRALLCFNPYEAHKQFMEMSIQQIRLGIRKMAQCGYFEGIALKLPQTSIFMMVLLNKKSNYFKIKQIARTEKNYIFFYAGYLFKQMPLLCKKLMALATEKKLTDKKINPTAMRLLVLDFLLKKNSAIRLTDIEKGMEPADRTTIYRTLKTFEEKGLVHSIDDGTGFPKYALCADACDADERHDLHVHFYCIRCKETFCLSNSKIPDISLPDKFHPLEMNLVVKGICDHCTN